MRAIATMFTIRRAAMLAAVLGLMALLVAGAAAFWSGGDAHGNAAAVATTLGRGPAPTAVSNGDHVHVTWGVATAANGRPADGYIVRRYNGAGAEQAIRAGCDGVIALTSGNTCAELGLPAGQWTYTVTPVMGTNWRGDESEHSGVVETGPMTLILNRSVFGASPTPTTGTLSGFAPNETITYLLDTSAIVGSPSRAGADGTATITSIALPAGLTDGPHTVHIVGGGGSHAEASILVDTVAPTINGFLTPAPNAAGWNNTSPVEVNGTVDDGDGSGLATVRFTNDGTDPRTSPTAQLALAPPMADATSTYRYYGTDLAGNESAVKTLAVKIDTIAPFPASIELTDVHGGAWIDSAASTTYYRGTDAGSFSFLVSLIDPGGPAASGPASVADSALNGTDAGFSTDSETISTPAGGPFVLNPITWIAGTTANPVGTITFTDVAGNTLVGSGQILDDPAAPAGGSVDAAGLVGTGRRYSTSRTLTLSLAKGSDSGSGLADGTAPTDAPARLTRSSAPLSSDGVANGSCGTYGAYVTVGAVDPAASATDTVPADNTCYRYRYLVSDHVGNVAAYTSADIKVKTTPVAALTPTAATVTAVSGTAAQSSSGATVFYNPAQSGSFNVDSSAASAFVGIAHVDFPAITGFSGGGAVVSPVTGTVFRGTYAWSANGAAASPGAQAISATNNAGETATNGAAFSVVKDDVGPSGGTVDAAGLAGTGGRFSTSMTLTVGFAPGTDGGAGLAPGGTQLLRASAPLISGGIDNGNCGPFGFPSPVADNPISPKADTVPVDRTCYRYAYVVSDAVGNQTTYTSPAIKVYAAAPPAPTLTFSGLSNAGWSGTGTAVFYRPGASSGGFTVTANSVDAAAYAFPALAAGWSSASAGSGVQSYSWASANPTAPVGTRTVTMTSLAGTNSTAGFTVTPDTTAPTGGNVIYTNGYTPGSTVSISFGKGTDTGSGVDAASGIIETSTAPLAAGACGTFGPFTTAATNPASGVSLPVVTNTCYRYRYLISDRVGNQSVSTSASVAMADSVGPTNAITMDSPVAASITNTTIYYKGDVSGSFRLIDALTDAGSGPASATFPAIATTGWTHDLETVSTPTGGPYLSSTFSWTPNPGAPTNKALNGTDVSGKQSTNGSISFQNDTTPPSGGSVTYPNGVVTSTSLPVTVINAGDPLSGIDPTSPTIRRDSAPLSTATETCGTFAGTFGTSVTLVAGADASVVGGRCYQYRLLVSDKVGNVATFASANVAKIDTSGPQVTAITSLQANGTAGDGRLAVGDRLVLGFNQSLAPASVPTSFTNATESSPGALQDVTLTIPGITQGALDTGSAAYLALPGTTATFAGTAALTGVGTGTTLTLSVTSVGGAATAASTGAMTFRAAATITDGGGNATAATTTTALGFKLF